MSDFFKDGQTERFVDEVESPIPPVSTWNNLTPAELIDVRSKLIDRTFLYAKNPQILKMLNESIKKIDSLISK